jgi:hypothetical protein
MYTNDMDNASLSQQFNLAKTSFTKEFAAVQESCLVFFSCPDILAIYSRVETADFRTRGNFLWKSRDV